MAMDAKPSVNKLSETIHSLLGLKAHLTSTWVASVCDIVKNLQPQVSTTDLDSSNFGDKDGYLSTEISKIKDELAALTTRISNLNVERRRLLNEFLDLKGNIRVFYRIRPLTLGESFGRFRPVAALDSSNVVLQLSDQKSKRFTFDKVFHPDSSQDEVFSEIEPVIKSVLDGYNACIFAYGQTGTGKTFTMEGTEELPGVVPRAIKALFKQATDSNHTFLISFSMLEIYMGNLRDLLVARPTRATDPSPPCLTVQTDPKGGVEIENLVAINVNDYNQVLKLYKLGCRFRSTASTGSNSTSSRSHCMIRISISCFNAPERRRETNKIWLVDLGGSERVLKTRASGKRLEEGKAINLSLSALGDVISALQRKKSHVPYRNSKLTQVLKDSLGQDSKTLMLVHVSPKEEDLCETVCSLSFATRARSIHLGTEDTAEERYHKEALMMSLQQKMKQIEEERCIVRGEVQRLNEKLESLTGTATPSIKELQSPHLSIETPNSNQEPVKNKTRDLRKVPSSQLPRFMRPTVASRTRIGNENSLSENKGLNGPTTRRRRRRRPPSNRAESVALPLKAGSEYNSECSISRASCIVTMNVKHFADNETEYSQDMTESEIKTVAFSESEKQSRLSGIPKAQYPKKKFTNGNSTPTGFYKVENWLHSHDTERLKSNNHRTKLLLANSAKRPTHHAKRNSQEIPDEIPIKDIVIHDEMTEFSLELSDETVNKVSRTSSNPLSCITDDEKERYSEHEGCGSVIEDDECRTPPLPDTWLQEIKGSISKIEFDEIFATEEVEDQVQPSETSELKDLECSPCCSFLDCTTTDPKKHVLDSMKLENESNYRNTCDTDYLFQCSTGKTRYCLRKLKCQRALFEDGEGKNYLTFPNLRSQQISQTSGPRLINLLTRKSQTLWATTLLGLGICDLGYDSDFYSGLML